MKLEEIEKLCSEATCGPWKLCFHLRSEENDTKCACGYRGGIWGNDGEHMVCEMGSTVIKGEEGLEPARYDRDTEIANAKFIAAARTLMPKLLAVARAAKEYEQAKLNSDACPSWNPCYEECYQLSIEDFNYLQKALEELEKE